MIPNTRRATSTFTPSISTRPTQPGRWIDTFPTELPKTGRKWAKAPHPSASFYLFWEKGAARSARCRPESKLPALLAPLIGETSRCGRVHDLDGQVVDVVI